METKAEKAYNSFFDAPAKKSKIQIFFQKKEGFYEITENITNKQEIHFDYFLNLIGAVPIGYMFLIL